MSDAGTTGQRNLEKSGPFLGLSLVLLRQWQQLGSKCHTGLCRPSPCPLPRFLVGVTSHKALPHAAVMGGGPKADRGV